MDNNNFCKYENNFFLLIYRKGVSMNLSLKVFHFLSYYLYIYFFSESVFSGVRKPLKRAERQETENL